jgi:hypoxanthine-guanine phosphoribosyltransferase
MDIDELPRRTPWDGFPDVVICAAESAVKNHPDYPQAKQGNVQDAAPAATRLSASFLNAETAQGVRGMVTEATWLVPVHALEGQGFNRIPAAFAEVLARHFGVQVETSIIQINVVNHTGASGWQRMSAPPLFEGGITEGRRYLLVDDFVGQGSTLANLRGHIAHQGGSVVGAVCLTGRSDSVKLALTQPTLDSLRAKHGTEIEQWWLQEFGYDFSCLTESEGRYLLRVEDADAIRTRIGEARSAGHN